MEALPESRAAAPASASLAARDLPAATSIEALSIAHRHEVVRLACRRLLYADDPLPRTLGLPIADRPMPGGFPWETLLGERLSVLPPTERADAIARLAATLAT